MATHDPFGTVAAVITTPPTLPGAGLTFTEPTFGTLLGQITGRSDEENAQLTVSTLNAGFNYDSTRMIVVVYGGTNYGYWVYTLDPATLLSSRTKNVASIPGTLPHMETAQWDWSGTQNYRLLGVVNDNGDTFRQVKYVDVQSNAVGIIYDYLEDLRTLAGGTIVSTTSSSVFVGNQTDPEALTNLYTGQTLTFRAGATGGATQGQTRAITGYNATTKQFTTAAFTTTPTVGAAYYIDYVGYTGQFALSADGRYCAWAVTEGQTNRGTQGQDAARTVFFYDIQTGAPPKKHRVSNAETNHQSATALIGATGIHNIQIDKSGSATYVMISGFGGPPNSVVVWDPRGTNPTPATGDGTITLFTNGQHRDLGLTNWCQMKVQDANGSSHLQLRTFAAPGDGSGGIVWTNPPFTSTVFSVGANYYLTWNHAVARQDFIFLALDMCQTMYAWALDSGSVYKVNFALWMGGGNAGGNQPLTPANNGYVHHNGTRLPAAVSRAAMTVGTHYYDAGTNLLYVWPLGSIDLINQVTDLVGTVVTPSSGSNTATRFAVSLTSTTPAAVIGRKWFFDNSGTHLYLMRTITNYEVIGGDHFVTVASLPFVPSAGQPGRAKAHQIGAWDQRAYVNEVTKVYLDGSGIAQRVSPLYGVINDASDPGSTTGTSQFAQQAVLQSNRDGTLVAFSTQKFNGGDTSYVFVASMPIASSGNPALATGSAALTGRQPPVGLSVSPVTP